MILLIVDMLNAAFLPDQRNLKLTKSQTGTCQEDFLSEFKSSEYCKIMQLLRVWRISNVKTLTLNECGTNNMQCSESMSCY